MSTDVAEVLDKTVRDRIENAKKQPWTISKALTTDYTRREKDPPNDYSRTYNSRITIGNLSRTIIKKAKWEYGLGSSTETIKKLLRVGIPKIYIEWEEELETLNNADKAIIFTSEYLEQGHLQSYADKTGQLNIATPEQESKQHRILWCQYLCVKNLSKELGFNQSSILQLAILLAGRELGYIDDIATPTIRKIESNIQSVDAQIQNRSQTLRLLAFGSMTEGLSSEYEQVIYDKLDEECPRIVENFMEKSDNIEPSDEY